MKIISAKLIYWNEIEVKCDGYEDYPHFDFYIDSNRLDLDVTYSNGSYFLKFNYDGEVLGHWLSLVLNYGESNVVSILEAPLFDYFDDAYTYTKDDLGANYNKDYTEFVLWAPLAVKVVLHIDDEYHELKREDKGIFRLKLDGDYSLSLYDYILTIDAKEVFSIDPYGRGSNANGERSAVIDFARTSLDLNSNLLSNFKENTEAIIYETHIRDFTISKNTNIENKGKYLGFVEENRTSKGGNPVGIDHLKKLGITHVQLLPVLDYASVNELSKNEYNWGYDPMQFFTLEGSYSLNPNDPYSRINEFKKMISELHRNNIRINLDVVYNHVYKVNDFSLNKITPNYFFRFERDKLANHSGCGNDFASERTMARKFIIDSLTFLMKEYDVDGFRFDLMGLLDLETMKQASEAIKKIKPNAMIYGEGWEMGVNSKYAKEFATMSNASKLEQVGFFNDSYRNIMRGVGDKAELREKGFLLGNANFDSGFKFAFLGSTSDITYPHLFNSYNQSINYVECHDNAALYDVISESSEIDDKLRIIKLFNKVLLLSPGVPFIHMGQEYGLSKKNQANTYNLGDYYNAFNPDLLDERYDLVNSMKGYIEVRKTIKLLSKSNPIEVNSNISFNENDGVYEIVMKDNIVFHIYINKNENKVFFNDLKFSYMELYVPRNCALQERVSLINTGIGPWKCSIYKYVGR